MPKKDLERSLLITTDQNLPLNEETVSLKERLVIVHSDANLGLFIYDFTTVKIQQNLDKKGLNLK